MKTNNPVRLNKQPDTPLTNWEAWAITHAPIIITICLMVLFALVIAVALTMGVSAHPTGTEANVWQNMEAII
jgi:hypothetical protein